MMNHGEKLGKLIYLERRLETNPRNQKSLNLDKGLQKNHQVNKKEISEIHEKPKLKLKLTKITIRIII